MANAGSIGTDLTPTQSIRIRGIIQSASNTDEKALLIESEVGLDPIYSMIAMGQTMVNLAASLGLSIFELKYILKRTPDHRKKFIHARTFKLVEDSMTVIENAAVEPEFSVERSSAIKHHSNLLDKGLKHLNESDEKQGNRVIVNNTIVVGDSNEVPKLPDGLNEILEAEYVDTET